MLTDDAINILNRITFYDIDSNPIKKNLSEEEKKYYLKEIKKDITYFNRTYKKADIWINIAELNPDQTSKKLKRYWLILLCQINSQARHTRRDAGIQCHGW